MLSNILHCLNLAGTKESLQDAEETNLELFAAQRSWISWGHIGKCSRASSSRWIATAPSLQRSSVQRSSVHQKLQSSQLNQPTLCRLVACAAAWLVWFCSLDVRLMMLHVHQLASFLKLIGLVYCENEFYCEKEWAACLKLLELLYWKTSVRSEGPCECALEHRWQDQ